MKDIMITIIGAVSAAIAAAFGGWSSAMTTLVILMAADYITGLIVAGLFKASPKTDTGGLSSEAGWQGLVKKCVVLFFVYVGSRLDIVMGTTYLKDAICIAYIVNELISLVENAGLMGVPVPAPIMSAIDALKKRGNTEG